MSGPMVMPRTWLAVCLILTLGLAGCGPTPIDDSFDRSRGDSINGTSALVELFRERGHEVRLSRRLNETQEEWADVLVWFAPYPGPPDEEKGDRIYEWITNAPGRQVIYVPHDYDAGPDFWSAVLATKPATAKPEWIKQVEKNRDASRNWVSRLPTKPKKPSDASEWFGLRSNPGPPAIVTRLDGVWAEGVDTKAAAITRHETFLDGGETPLLLDEDDRPLAITWTVDAQSSFLVVANASFLLNGALINPARRPLTERVVDWVGDEPRHIVFLDGDDLLESGESDETGVFHLLSIFPFNWIAAHLAVLGLLAALARAVRLGRPVPEPPSGVERPSAHPEALGGLLARTRNVAAARDLLETYHRWRHPSNTTPSPRVHRS